MLTQDELRHTHMLTAEEQVVVKWQFGLYGGFYTTLFELIKQASDNNLFRLELGLPIEVGGFLKYIIEKPTPWKHETIFRVNSI